MDNLIKMALFEFLLKFQNKAKKETWDKDCKVFIGGLKHNVRKSDLMVRMILLVNVYIKHITCIIGKQN